MWVLLLCRLSFYSMFFFKIMSSDCLCRGRLEQTRLERRHYSMMRDNRKILLLYPRMSLVRSNSKRSSYILMPFFFKAKPKKFLLCFNLCVSHYVMSNLSLYFQSTVNRNVTKSTTDQHRLIV